MRSRIALLAPLVLLVLIAACGASPQERLEGKWTSVLADGPSEHGPAFGFEFSGDGTVLKWVQRPGTERIPESGTWKVKPGEGDRFELIVKFEDREARKATCWFEKEQLALQFPESFPVMLRRE